VPLPPGGGANLPHAGPSDGVAPAAKVTIPRGNRFQKTLYRLKVQCLRSDMTKISEHTRHLIVQFLELIANANKLLTTGQLVLRGGSHVERQGIEHYVERLRVRSVRLFTLAMKAREDGLADRADDLTKLANLSLSKAEALELASYQRPDPNA